MNEKYVIYNNILLRKSACDDHMNIREYIYMNIRINKTPSPNAETPFYFQ